MTGSGGVQSNYDVVVVGGGKAGSQAVASLRDEGFTGSILLVGDEGLHPYDRPPLSKGFLTGDVLHDALPLRSAGYYSDAGVTVLLGEAASRLDVVERTLFVGARRIGYGELIIATGADLRMLDVPGSDALNVIGLKNLDHAIALQFELASARSVVVIGGGFIGLEVAAAAARHFGCEVTVLEALPRVMARTGLPETAAFVAAHHVDNLGVNIRANTAAVAIEQDERGRAVAVTLSSGERIPADLVVFGIGVTPRTSLAEGGGLLVQNGIVVDSTLRASASHVWAIGDCASFPNTTFGTHIRLESVQNATDQARCVAAQIATGNDVVYQAVPWFWSDQDTLKIQSVGIMRPDDERILAGTGNGGFSVLAFREGVLVGGDSVNQPGDHLALRRLMSAAPAVRATLTVEVAADDSFQLKGYVRALLSPPDTARAGAGAR